MKVSKIINVTRTNLPLAFWQQLFEDMSLRWTQCLLLSQYHRTQSSVLFQSSCDKESLNVLRYNLPAQHKLNLRCFLQLTKKLTFNGSQSKPFHPPRTRQYISPIGRMVGRYCERDKADWCRLQREGEVAFQSCSKPTKVLIRGFACKQFLLGLRQIHSTTASTN